MSDKTRVVLRDTTYPNEKTNYYSGTGDNYAEARKEAESKSSDPDKLIFHSGKDYEA